MLALSIVEADDGQRLGVASLYRACGYGGRISDRDAVLVALDSGRLLGAVRICREDGVLVLRGMQVLPEYRRRGIGTRLLRACEKLLGGETCFCVPWRHLEGFYGMAGFNICEPEYAPTFLVQRHSQYLEKGMHVVMMVRA